jgi:hypothetical protein
MSKEVDAERTKLSSADEAYEQIFEERVALTALIEYLDSLVDGGVMAIVRDVSVITGNKTDDTFYKLLFPVQTHVQQGRNRFGGYLTNEAPERLSE